MMKNMEMVKVINTCFTQFIPSTFKRQCVIEKNLFLRTQSARHVCASIRPTCWRWKYGMWDAISLLLPYQIGSSPAPPHAAPSNVCALSEKRIAHWNSTRFISSSAAKCAFLMSSDIFFYIVEMRNSRPTAQN